MLKNFLTATALFVFAQSAIAQTSEEKTSGYVNITELNFTKGFATSYKTNSDNHLKFSHPFSYGIQTINGYKFNSKLMAGIGVGLDRFNGGGYILPIFADFRVLFGNNKVKPFFDQSAGFALNITNWEYNRTFKDYGSFLLGSGFGISIPCSFAESINLGLGYRFQYNKLHFTYPEEIKITTHSATLKAGLTF